MSCNEPVLHLRRAFRTVSETLAYFDQMDAEAELDRLEFIRDQIYQGLRDWGVPARRLELDEDYARSSEYSMYAPEEETNNDDA
jgi:hypothetical protein